MSLVQDLENDKTFFMKEYKTLVKDLEQKNGIEEKAKISFIDLTKVAEYLNTVKPQSHVRNHKFTILEYLTELKSLSENNNTTEIDFLTLKKDKLNSITHFVNIKNGYSIRNNLIHSYALIGIIIDILLSISGIAKHYFYIPIFMLIFLIIGSIKHKKAKSENKILEL
ncbi:hypothetical protein [Psychroserpens sp. SPM9]|uniref:hypothetical protein n=1 Tax=Psychroserpens sp. SPM9 TaxID=2975598 RepID=UPI0021A5FF6C|nr:hypothetical protein [Psychroserpens sp. SPM9]MDG5493239.1 hypothetical protein [Psychroserpens sp. SPM9]